MSVLVTGAAGFIGFHVARRLLDDGEDVIGLDNFNAYYDVALKEARWAELGSHSGFTGLKGDIAERGTVESLFAEHKPAQVVHLAAQAGVRYGLDHPHDYAQANLVGQLNILEGCRAAQVGHLVFASTSSVYGANGAMPFAEHHGAAHQVSLYAATKRGGEAMAHAYAHLFQIPTTGLRFFTVYGPWGRPDMALFTFTEKILAGEPIAVFNDGHMARDFTYIDDIVEGVVRVLARPPSADGGWDPAVMNPASSGVAPYRLYNIGRGEPVRLLEFIETLEQALGKTAAKDFQPMQPGDVEQTWCDVEALAAATGYRPQVSLKEGVGRFVAWYRDFYKV